MNIPSSYPWLTLNGWFRFWFPNENVDLYAALLRVGIATIFLYSALIRTIDFYPFNTLDHVLADTSWFEAFWQWASSTSVMSYINIGIVFAALTLLLGINVSISAPLCLLGQWFYLTIQTPMNTPLDSLLAISLFYLCCLPCGRVLVAHLPTHAFKQPINADAKIIYESRVLFGFCILWPKIVMHAMWVLAFATILLGVLQQMLGEILLLIVLLVGISLILRLLLKVAVAIKWLEESPSHFLPPQSEGGMLQSYWSGMMLRALQVHVCFIYWFSALGKLRGNWMAGELGWHPYWMERTPDLFTSLLSMPSATLFVSQLLLLFEISYGLLIWFRPLRLPMLGLALLFHMVIGLGFGLWSFNVLMLVLNLVFIPPNWFKIFGGGKRRRVISTEEA